MKLKMDLVATGVELSRIDDSLMLKPDDSDRSRGGGGEGKKRASTDKVVIIVNTVWLAAHRSMLKVQLFWLVKFVMMLLRKMKVYDDKYSDKSE